MSEPRNENIEMEGKALFQSWEDVDAFVKELVEKAITAFGPHPEYPTEQ